MTAHFITASPALFGHLPGRRKSLLGLLLSCCLVVRELCPPRGLVLPFSFYYSTVDDVSQAFNLSSSSCMLFVWDGCSHGCGLDSPSRFSFYFLLVWGVGKCVHTRTHTAVVLCSERRRLI